MNSQETVTEIIARLIHKEARVDANIQDQGKIAVLEFKLTNVTTERDVALLEVARLKAQIDAIYECG